MDKSISRMENGVVLPHPNFPRPKICSKSLARSKRNYVEDLAVNYESDYSAYYQRRTSLLLGRLFFG